MEQLAMDRPAHRLRETTAIATGRSAMSSQDCQSGDKLGSMVYRVDEDRTIRVGSSAIGTDFERSQGATKMNLFLHVTTKRGLRALILGTASLAAAVAVLATPSRASTITFNPNGGGAGAISGVSGFGYATSSAVAVGLPTPTVGATFNVFYESVINATQGTASTIGSNFSINNSANQFTVIAGFRETITNITNGTVTFANASGPSFATGTTSPNFFEILANPTSSGVNPFTGNGANFGSGTVILTGHLVDSVNGSFNLTTGAGGAPVVGPFNTSGLATADTTTQSLQGGGGTQLTVQVDTANSGYFVTAPTFLMFSTTNSLPFNSVAPLTGFYSGPNATPNITYPGTPPSGFNTGTTNALDGNSLMFQSVATSSFSSAVPEPSAIIQALTASAVIPLFLGFRRRRGRKTAV